MEKTEMTTISLVLLLPLFLGFIQEMFNDIGGGYNTN
jgi:hypothetical protein